jgi:RNA polymerase sigma factor (sigma-70 family)
MVSTRDELIRTRTSLIRRLKDWDDQDGWQDFFDTYGRFIHNVALKSGLSEAEAEDVVQETMVSVAKRMLTFSYDRRSGSFKTWLLNVTRWRITDQIRKRGWHKALPLPPPNADQTVDLTGPNLEAVWNAEWENRLLEAATSKVKRRLDPQKYQIFDYYVNKQWAAPKVAKAFGISIDQVYMARHRVAGLLKDEVQRLRATA